MNTTDQMHQGEGLGISDNQPVALWSPGMAIEHLTWIEFLAAIDVGDDYLAAMAADLVGRGYSMIGDEPSEQSIVMLLPMETA